MVILFPQTEFTGLYDAGMYGRFLEDQIMLADVVPVNKTDLADEGTIAQAVNRIESVNPRAVLVRAEYAEVRGALIPRSPGEMAEAEHSASDHSQWDHCHLAALSFRVKQGIELSAMRALFDDLAQGSFGPLSGRRHSSRRDRDRSGSTLVRRMAGCVPFAKDVADSKLVIIGDGLNRETIELYCNAQRVPLF